MSSVQQESKVRKADMTIRMKMMFVILLSVVLVSGCLTIRPPRKSVKLERTLLTTGYCKCGECCGWKRNWYGKPVYKSGSLKGKRKKVGITATGKRAKHGTIAADTSRYPFGTVMYVPGYGYGIVQDVGGGVKGEHIDLYFRSHNKALKWGKNKKKVKIWIPK